MAQRRRLTRSRLDFEEDYADEQKTANGETDLELSVALPLRWSHKLGSLLRPGSLGRRWAMCEWFCSPVDQAFLQGTSEFAAMASQAGAPEGPLPRARWTALRRAMGRPRRFSAAFLRIERANMLKSREDETMTRRRQGQEAWIRSGARLLAFHPQRHEIVCGVAGGPGRGGVWLVFNGESHKRCVPLSDAMPAPAPPQPQERFAPFSLEDLERVATLSALLSSKEACLDALGELHDRAEAGGTVEQRDYAIRVLQLDEINKLLAPALAAAVTPLMAAKIESALVEREATDIMAQQPQMASSPAVRAQVFKCLQLCVAIRRVLERWQSGGQALAEARLQLHTALASLKPNENAPAHAPYREISEFVSALLR